MRYSSHSAFIRHPAQIAPFVFEDQHVEFQVERLSEEKSTQSWARRPNGVSHHTGWVWTGGGFIRTSMVSIWCSGSAAGAWKQVDWGGKTWLCASPIFSIRLLEAQGCKIGLLAALATFARHSNTWTLSIFHGSGFWKSSYVLLQVWAIPRSSSEDVGNPQVYFSRCGQSPYPLLLVWAVFRSRECRFARTSDKVASLGMMSYKFYAKLWHTKCLG